MLILENERRNFFPPVDNDFFNTLRKGRERDLFQNGFKNVSFRSAGGSGSWAGATGSCMGCLGLLELGLCFHCVRAMQWSQKHFV